VLAPGELDARVAGGHAAARALPPLPAPAPPAPHPFLREVERQPLFRAGDRVRTRNLQPQGHTRLTAYARRQRGVVARVYPACVFPDRNAHFEGEQPQHVYAVRFEARELWGESAEPGTCVHLDCFEPYLEPDPDA
jgi:hypothetical protein